MENITIENLYDLTETIAAELFTEAEYPWEVLPRIHDFILELGKRLPEEIYEKRGEDIWVAKNAKVAPTACLNGPLIIDEEAEIRHCAFVRGNAIVGKGAVVGNSTELKNVVLFNKVQVPHYNLSLIHISFTAEWRAVEGSKYYNSPALYKENGFKKKEDAERLIACLLYTSRCV